ncbi:MAG TPA: hypothetical protein PLC65_17935, partial [Bacteroidia bacterium]|nr:hypothetical protein [Bacteroidia bacterium]
DENAWPAHQAHGDTKGPCPQTKVGGTAPTTPTKGGAQPLGNEEIKTGEVKSTEGSNIKTGRPR